MNKPEDQTTGTPSLCHCSVASDWDHRIIDAVSIAMGGEIGNEDDANRLRGLLEVGDDNSTKEPIDVACDIAVAFIRWAQDLRKQRNYYRDVCPACDMADQTTAHTALRKDMIKKPEEAVRRMNELCGEVALIIEMLDKLAAEENEDAWKAFYAADDMRKARASLRSAIRQMVTA